VLTNLHQLPTAVADLLRAFPYDFLYGNIAADTSLAKKYAPVGRHCHSWHVGQEIHDLAPTDPLRAFGMGYLSHLAADTVAHNFFVPRQLVLTASTAALGHSYWESRFETHLGDAYARTAKEVIQRDHTASDTHLDGILSPTIFSVKTSRRLFRGMVHLTETQSWQWTFQQLAEKSRWDLADADVERHMAVAFEYVMEQLGDGNAAAPRPHQALGGETDAPHALREGARTGRGGVGRRTLRPAAGIARLEGVAGPTAVAGAGTDNLGPREFMLRIIATPPWPCSSPPRRRGPEFEGG
jgi:hypothetical protein